MMNDAGMKNSMYFLPEFMISSIQSMKATFTLQKHAHVIYIFFSKLKLLKSINRKNKQTKQHTHKLWVHDQNAVLTSTHNLCFLAKIRKTGIPMYTPVLLYKSGVQRGILFMDLYS